MAMADFRRDYGLGGLNRSDLDANPLVQFNRWFGQASTAQSRGRWRKIGIALYKLWQAALGREAVDANAMTLATADQEGRPSARAVLLRGLEDRKSVV